MFGRNEVSDKALQKTVDQRIARSGSGSQSRITANVQQGTVTLLGNLQYEIQRSPIVKSVANLPGVRRVIDQLKLVPKQR